MPTRSYLLPNLPTCSLKSYSTTTSNIESLFVHDTPPPMPTSQHMTYRTVLHQQWSSLGIQIFQRSEIPWRRNDWYTAPGACTTSSLLYISAGFTRTANYSESWESRLRHRWLIFQQDSKIVPCKDETLRNLSIAISDETMSFSPSWDGFIIGPLFRLEFSNHSVHNSNHGWSYNLPDILVIILIEPCRKVLPAPHLPEQSQKPSCPSMGTILWLIVITCIILWFRQRAHKSKFPLPPGPPADPIIGHLRYIPPENPEDKIAEWSRQYGRYFWVLVCEAG